MGIISTKKCNLNIPLFSNSIALLAGNVVLLLFLSQGIWPLQVIPQSLHRAMQWLCLEFSDVGLALRLDWLQL